MTADRFYGVYHFNGFILRDARKSGLLRMRSQTLMVRSAFSRVSNHEATEKVPTFRSIRKTR